MISRSLALGAIFAVSSAAAAWASVTTIPNSELIPSTGYYTDAIGGGIGNVVVMTGGAHAPGIGAASGRNDDGFSGPVNLGFTLDFFGQSYSTFYINNNGNVSFGAGIAAYVPAGPQGAAQPVISPYFGDVDTRGAASGVVHLRTNIPNEAIITWDQVGYYDSHTDKLNSFQLVLRGPGYSIPTGEGAIGFFWSTMQWEQTDTNVTAAVGFGDGASNGEVLQGSLQPGLPALLNDKHLWFDPNLVVVPPDNGGNGGMTSVPEPATIALLLTGLAGFGMMRRRA